MIGQARIYYIYQSLIFISVRIFLFIFLYTYVLLNALNNNPFNLSLIKFPLFLFSSFLIIETFFRFKILKVKPQIEVSKNDGKNIYNSFTLQALSVNEL